jgi:hypothetical protein
MPDCACVWVGDFDRAEFDSAEMRTARKSHACGECSRTIQPHEKYEHSRQKYDGVWYLHNTCADCLSIRESFFCDGWMFESVLDDLRGHIDALHGEIASECLVPLTPRAREQVCDMIEAAWLEED